MESQSDYREAFGCLSYHFPGETWVTHRDAVSGSILGPHGDTCSTQAAFIHVRGNLT